MGCPRLFPFDSLLSEPQAYAPKAPPIVALSPDVCTMARV